MAIQGSASFGQSLQEPEAPGFARESEAAVFAELGSPDEAMCALNFLIASRFEPLQRFFTVLSVLPGQESA